MDVVVRIEEIWRHLSQPRILRSLARPVPLRIFTAKAIVAEPLSYMRANNFSQTIALRDEKHLVLSAEGITHWLEAKSKEDIISLSETRTSSISSPRIAACCVYLKASDTVDQAREVFASDIGKRIFSALVTENGSAKEKPINIVTPWDFMAGALQK